MTDPLATLLAYVDAQSYELLRTRLVTRFRSRALPDPESLADEAFDRVARKLVAGEQPRDVTAYALGVARLIALEAQRRCCRLAVLDRDVPAIEEEDAEIAEPSAHLACLSVLSAPAVQLLLRYEEGVGGERRARRRALAEELGIPLNALRIRVHRLREKVLAHHRTCPCRPTTKLKLSSE